LQWLYLNKIAWVNKKTKHFCLAFFGELIKKDLVLLEQATYSEEFAEY
jgi:hypothetical protein